LKKDKSKQDQHTLKHILKTMNKLIAEYLSIADEMEEDQLSGRVQVESDFLGKRMFSGDFSEARDLVTFVRDLGFDTVRSPDHAKQAFAEAANRKAKKSGSSKIHVIIDDPAIHPDVETILTLIVSCSSVDNNVNVDGLVQALKDKNYDQVVINKVVKFVKDKF